MTDAKPETRRPGAEWLEQVLQQSGALPRGRVLRADVTEQQTMTSALSWIKVGYSDDAPASAPVRLLLKITRPGFHPQFGRNEVEFYRRVAPAMTEAPVVRCCYAAYSPEKEQSYLLLEDLSESHAQVLSRVPAPRETYERIMDCLARFHAYWWEHPRLGRDIGALPSEPDFASMGRTLDGFLSFLGAQLTHDRQQTYRRVLDAMPGLWRRDLEQRFRPGVAITLIHGDAHFENFLLPREGHQDSIRMIDWQFWNVNLGPRDLAFMIARNWTREQRAQLERPLVRCYYDCLAKYGVTRYRWEDCWDDYRRCAAENILIPMWQWQGALTPSTDWDGLNRAFDAFEDLECEELLL